ncbi:hypothetical protein CYLTODRAFT_416481 [Cylindrobasidium torrendii FP15055 ss-10]|uniref:PCI domain-containing protein n=1 Tax=Cylindrobasidium torrendii FP15055 ss-10 TaxID=1314674 RepID=A0A0D7BUH6_9AGAR|nr:hypothetical protein CYLTODRAFT_416481 [Cylindrobasidium torrendii FP15055 ss-10]
MDIDQPEDVQPGTSQPRRPSTVLVDDAHPFDLESYISNYSGRTVVDRLMHIIGICPTIAVDAFKLAIQHIHLSRDPTLYQQLSTAYEQATAQPDNTLPPISSLPMLDQEWIDKTLAKNNAERTKLENELKTYNNNMIKESIRMAHRDLGDFYRSVGDYPTALKHYTKSREFCSTGQHVLDMCLSVLELLIEQRNYGHIPTYVFKAEAALEAVNSAATANATNAAEAKKNQPDNSRIHSRLDLASSLASLGQGAHEKASYNLLRLGGTKDFGDWMGKIISPGDIAVYGTLCAMACLSRSGFKAQVLDNPTFGVYLEQEPYLRELVDAYMASKFQTVLSILEKYSTRHYIDVHLSSHVNLLAEKIKNKAVVLYFQPFSSIRLDRMSGAFGWTVDETEAQVVALIQTGSIQGRVDSQNKVLQVKAVDHRTDLLSRATKAGAEIQNANRKLLLRMKLQQADLVIKAPKGHQSNIGEFISVDQ